MGSESENTKPKKGRSFSVGSRVFNPSLRLRIIFIIVGASLIIFLVTTLLLLSYQRGQLIESTESTTMALSSAILANLKHAMLTGDADLINDSVLAVVDERAVDTLRILDDQGVVSASSVEGEIGKIFIRTEPECQICHEGNRTPTNKSTIYTPSDGHRVLLNINLVQNQEECQTCHDSEDEILGLLMMESSLTSVDQQLVTGFWRTILIALASFALLIGLVIPALNRFIVQPIEELSKGVAEISDGNLDYQVPVVYQDELGALAELFDSMRQQLKITRTEMELRERELASLNEVGLAATQLLDLHENSGVSPGYHGK